MKSIFPAFVSAIFLLLIASVDGIAQGDTKPVSVDAKVITLPKVTLPKEAKETGLGGRVSVKAEIDARGNIASVSDVTGPDWTRPAVVRPDVLALRAAAKTAALKAKVSPATMDGIPQASTLWIDFQFNAPERKQKDGGLAAGKAAETEYVDRDSGKVETGLPKFGRLSDDPPKKMTTAVGSVEGTSGSTVDTDTRMPAVGSPSLSGKTISGGVLNGKAIKLPKPTYPPAARAVRASGAVSVQVLIDTDGTMFSARAIAGHPLLRHSSEISACGSQFTPTLLNNEPVKVAGIIVYNYVP